MCLESHIKISGLADDFYKILHSFFFFLVLEMTLGRDLSLKAIYNLVTDPDKAFTHRVIGVLIKRSSGCVSNQTVRRRLLLEIVRGGGDWAES